MTRAAVRVRPVGKGDWELVEQLFGPRGACAGCWCMAWRLSRARWEAGRGAPNRRALKRLVQRGGPLGVLAVVREETVREGAKERAVGWCSAAPRAEFVALETKRSLATDWDERTWSVTCFFVAKDWRKRGLGRRLLEGAVRLARTHGATRVEGYPVPPPRAGGELPAAFAWTGLPAVFERCGFSPLAESPGKRPIHVKTLAARKGRRGGRRSATRAK